MERWPEFETFDDAVGDARWRLVGANGEKMAASEPYASTANARRGIRDAQVAVLRTIQHALGDELSEVEQQILDWVVERIDGG